MSSSYSSSKSACSTRPRYSPTFRIAPAMRTPCVRSEMTPLRLPGHGALTEYRAPDAKVCRAGGNRLLEVVGHPRRDDLGVGMVVTERGRQAYEVVEVGRGVLPQRRDGHESAEGEPGRLIDRRREIRYARGHDARPTGIRRREVDLDQAGERTSGRHGSP